MDDIADERTRLAALCGRRPSPRGPPPRDWSKLPADILYEVMCRLSSLHHRLSLAAVCRNWHASVRRSLPYALPKQFLALPRPHPHERFFTFRRRSSALKPHQHHPKSRHRGCYRGATGSQLLFATDGAYTLVNPFTGRERLLPATSGIRLHEHEEINVGDEEGYSWSEEMPVRKLVVCPDGLVAAILGHERSAKVALCGPESAAWSWSLGVQDPWRWYEDMVFFDGKLYALTNDEDLLAMEIGYDDESGAPRILHVECVVAGGGRGYTLQEYTRMRYLVVRPRGGGLLMVCRVMLEHGSTTYQFLVFRADFPSSRWVEEDTLGGDEALFVGRLCSRAVTCADGHGDRIFFLDDSAGMEGPPVPADALANVYDMKDGRVTELLCMQPLMDEAVPATWLFRDDADADEYGLCVQLTQNLAQAQSWL